MRWLRYFYLAHLSQPAAERSVYRQIRRQRARRIVEIGIGTLSRTMRMIEVAALGVGAEHVTYTGIDLFESRSASDGPGVSLKLAHRRLMSTRARIRLLPGDPLSALSRAANELTDTDVIVISADQDADSLARAWFYVPRMLHADSQVFIERRQVDGSPHLDAVSRLDIERLAGTGLRRRAA